MPGVDRECVTHHACDCIQAKLEALRALVEEKDKALSLGMKGVWKADGVTPEQAHEALYTALALTEDDMRKRLEEK